MIKYQVEDKVFDTIEEAQKYEAKLKAMELKKKKLEAEREKREKELDDAWENYVELTKAFNKDYPDVCATTGELSLDKHAIDDLLEIFGL